MKQMSNSTACLAKAEGQIDFFKEMCKENCPDIYVEINEYQPKSIPSRPDKLAEFDRLDSQTQKDRLTENGFFQQTEIADYLNKKWSAESYNIHTFQRLFYLYKSDEDFPLGTGGDLRAKEAIRLKLTMFRAAIQANKKPFRAMQIDLKKYPFDDSYQEAGWDD
jgi:hypothetical protein